MDACPLLLGRSWAYDRRVLYNRYLNTYSFTKDGHKITLRPLHPEELAKQHKLVQDTSTRSEVVGHINKVEHVLSVMSREESKEEDHVPLVPSIDVSLLPKFKDVIPKDVLSGSPTIKSKEHQIYFIPRATIPNRPKDLIDFSS